MSFTDIRYDRIFNVIGSFSLISNHELIGLLNGAGYAWCVQFKDLFEGVDIW